MKNRTIFAAAFVLIGLLVILAPTVLFAVCESEKKMACYYTRQAEIGIGILIVALGVVYFFLKNKGTRLGIAIAEFFTSGLVLAFPLIVVSILLVIVSLIDIFFLAKGEKSE